MRVGVAHVAPHPPPLVDPAAAAMEKQKARAEVAEAERKLREWRQSRRVHNGHVLIVVPPFTLAIQPFAIVDGEEEIELKGVTELLEVGELRALIHEKMKSKPEPDRQRLFIVGVAGGQEPLEDETLPIGAYKVGPGVTLCLAMQDGAAAAARRTARARARAEVKARAEAKAARQAKLLGWSGVGLMIGLVLLMVWLSSGCGGNPCGEGGTCSGGLSAHCTCKGSSIGEFCETECDCGGNATAVAVARAANSCSVANCVMMVPVLGTNRTCRMSGGGALGGFDVTDALESDLLSPRRNKSRGRSSLAAPTSQALVLRTAEPRVGSIPLTSARKCALKRTRHHRGRVQQTARLGPTATARPAPSRLMAKRSGPTPRCRSIRPRATITASRLATCTTRASATPCVAALNRLPQPRHGHSSASCYREKASFTYMP